MSRGHALLTAAAAALLMAMSIRSWFQIRLTARDLRQAAGGDLDGPRRPSQNRLQTLVVRSHPGLWLDRRLQRAYLPLSVPYFVVATTACTVAAYAAIGSVLAPLFGVIAAALTPFACVAALDILSVRRLRAMVDQLPDLATALSGGASAGLSLQASMGVAGADLAPPLGPEIKRTLDLMSVGHGIEEALREFQERVPSRETRLVVVALTLQLRTGGNLVLTLRQLSTALERRRDTRREVLSLTSSVRSTSYMIAALSFGSVALLNSVRPGSVQRALDNPLGLAGMTIGTLMVALGLFAVRRYSAVEL